MRMGIKSIDQRLQTQIVIGTRQVIRMGEAEWMLHLGN